MSILFRNNITFLVCGMRGTIFRENGAINSTIKSTLIKMGYNKPVDTKEWFGLDKRQIFFNEIYKYYDPPGVKHIPPMVDEAEKIFSKELKWTSFEDNIELVDSRIPDFFSNIRMNGIKVGLTTSYSSCYQKELIKHLELEKHVDGFISSESVRYGKPSPHMIHRLMEQCDISNVNNVAKVGDSYNDMIEGKNAGCRLTIGVLTGRDSKEKLLKKGDFVANNLIDLHDDDVPMFLL